MIAARHVRPVAALGAVLALVLTGCSDSSSDSATPSSSAPATPAATGSSPSAAAAGGAACPADGTTIGFSAPLPDPNFQLLFGVIEGDSQRWGQKAQLTVANLDPGKQISDIQTLIDSGSKAIVVAPVSPVALQPVVERAKQKGVALVVTDTAIGGPYATNIQTQAREAGAEGADYLKAKVGDGKVAAILGPEQAEAVRVRNEGFLTRAKEIGLNVVDTKVNVKINAQDARAIADTWKQQYGKDLAAIWTFNDTSAGGVASALGGDFNPLVTGINAQPDGVQAVRDGRVTATWDLHPFELAHAMAWAADQARCGKELPPTIYVEDSVIDKTTVDSWVPWDTAKTQAATVSLVMKDGKPYVTLS